MSENGDSQPKASVTGEVLSLLEDQMELASLEWRYEKAQSVRRLAALGAAGFLSLTAFAILQVALIQGLVMGGLSLGWACVVLAGIYGSIAALLIWKFGRRDARSGEPFQGTRDEIRKNLKWIRQVLS